MTDKNVKPSANAATCGQSGGQGDSCGHVSDTAALAVVSNAVFAGLGTLYMSTGSVEVTAIAAGVVALVAVCLLVRRRVLSSGNTRKTK